MNENLNGGEHSFRYVKIPDMPSDTGRYGFCMFKGRNELTNITNDVNLLSGYSYAVKDKETFTYVNNDFKKIIYMSTRDAHSGNTWFTSWLNGRVCYSGRSGSPTQNYYQDHSTRTSVALGLTCVAWEDNRITFYQAKGGSGTFTVNFIFGILADDVTYDHCIYNPAVVPTS